MKTTSEFYSNLINDGYDIWDVFPAICYHVLKKIIALEYVNLVEQGNTTEHELAGSPIREYLSTWIDGVRDQRSEESIKSWVDFCIDCTVLHQNTCIFIHENEEHAMDIVLDSTIRMLSIMTIRAIHMAKLKPNEEKYGVVLMPIDDQISLAVKESLSQVHLANLVQSIEEIIDTVEDLENVTRKMTSEYGLVAGIAKMNAQNKEE